MEETKERKRLLLTGASGFIGSYFLEHVLKKTDWKIICLIGLTYASNVNEVRSLTKDYEDRITWLYHNLSSELTPDVLKRIGEVDYVVSFASQSHVDRSIIEPASFIKENVALAVNLLEACRLNLKPSKIVWFSTDEVYGPKNGSEGHTETSPFRPSNPYAASKAAQENIFYSYWRTYGLPIIITNSMNIIGARQNQEKFLPKTVRAILKGEPVKIHSDKQRTSSTRCWITAPTLSHSLFWILNNVESNDVADGTVLQKLHIAGPEVSCADLAYKAADVLGIVPTFVYEDFHTSVRGKGHDFAYALSDKKLRNLGYTYPISFDEEFKELVLRLKERFI
jgi:dTDP-glucose 4,6-dehydratase